jgi:hypothetical protein
MADAGRKETSRPSFGLPPSLKQTQRLGVAAHPANQSAGPAIAGGYDPEPLLARLAIIVAGPPTNRPIIICKTRPVTAALAYAD